MSLSTTQMGPRVSIGTAGSFRYDGRKGQLHIDSTASLAVEGKAAFTGDESHTGTVSNSGVVTFSNAVGLTSFSVPAAGSAISGIYSSVVSINFGAISSGVSSLITIPLAGVTANSAFIITLETAGSGGSTAQLSIRALSSTTPGEVSLTASNVSGLAINAGPQNLRITAIDFA